MPRGAERGKGLLLIREVSALIFGGTADWHLGDHLAKAVARAGLDLAELERDTDTNTDRYETIITENETAQKAAVGALCKQTCGLFETLANLRDIKSRPSTLTSPAKSDRVERDLRALR